MISDGDRVSLAGTGDGVVRYIKGSSARVAFDTGKERTVALARLKSREPKPIAVGSSIEPIMSSAEISGVLPDAPQLATHHPGRGVGQRVPFLRSAKYLAHVREHPCCNPQCTAVCRSEAHHWSHAGGVMGAKVDDYRAVPLCPMCHHDWHARGALPGLDPVGSRDIFIRSEASILRDWIAELSTETAAEVYIDAAVDFIRAVS